MDARKAWIRLGAYILALVAVAAARHFVFPDTGPEDVRQIIGETGPWAHVVLLGFFVLFGLAFLPLAWLMVVSGAAFGPPWALLWSYGGIVGASVLAYVVARQVRGRPRSWLEHRLPDVFTELDEGTWALMAVRAVPIMPESSFNAACGLRRVPARNFAVASAVGAVPGVLAYTMIGTTIGGLRLDDPSRWPWSLLGTIAAVTAFVAIGAWALHRGDLFE